MLRSCDASLVVFQHYRLMLTRKKLLTHVQALLLSTQKMYKVQDILCEVYYSYVLSGPLKSRRSRLGHKASNCNHHAQLNDF
jgi:hypothetical protein